MLYINNDVGIEACSWNNKDLLYSTSMNSATILPI